MQLIPTCPQKIACRSKSLRKISPKNLKKPSCPPENNLRKSSAGNRWKIFTASIQPKTKSNVPNPIPKNFQEKSLNPQWTKTFNNKDFLLHQGDDLLMFAIIQGLNFLVWSKNILGDETFKRALRPFLQFYAIFGSSESWKLPVVWVFLMRKSEGTYQNFARFWPKNALFLKFFFNVKIFWLILKLGLCRQSKKSFTSRAISDGGFTILSLYSENFRNSDFLDKIKIIRPCTW